MIGARKVVQCLGVFLALSEDPSWFPAPVLSS